MDRDREPNPSWMEQFEDYLQGLFDEIDTLETERIKQAMAYMLLSGGKRLRPRLFFSILSDYGLNPKDYFNIGAAIEMIHCYSLIHDDLPCMDDDTYRRGQLTCHKAFDEATALLAGDALLTCAFHLLTNPGPLTAQKQIELVRILSGYAGISSLILGQEFDLEFERGLFDLDSCDESEQMRLITQMNDLKTGSLFTAACQAAMVCANEPFFSVPRSTWLGISYHLGLLFQLQDDLLEYESDERKTGKSLSDLKHGKKTIPALIGVDEAREIAQARKDLIRWQLTLLGKEMPLSSALIESILNRET